MGSRCASIFSVLAWLFSGCECGSRGSDAGTPPDAPAPCSEPSQLVRYELDEAITSRYTVYALAAAATLPGHTVVLLNATYETTDATGITGTRPRNVVAAAEADRVFHELTPPGPDVVDMVDVGELVVVRGDGWTAAYGPDGWGGLHAPMASAMPCGGGHLAAVGPTIRIDDWSSGAPRPVAEGPAPEAHVLLDCALRPDGVLDLVFATRFFDDRDAPPVLVHVSPAGTFTSSPFGTAPIGAATLDGAELFTVDLALDRPTTVRMFRIEGGVPRQLDARPSLHAVTQTGTVHTVMAGRLFVTGLVGHVWDGRTIGPPWLISDLPATTDREHTWWVDDALGPRVAELRFCGGGL